MRVARILLLTSAALAGCRGGGVTGARLEGAIAPEFANLVHLQLEALGLPSVPAAALRVKATCRKVGAAPGENRGAGDWSCVLLWSGPDPRGGVLGARAPLQDGYDVAVGADGCFTAASGAESHLGGATLRSVRGDPVTNLVYAFDGCFDTGG